MVKKTFFALFCLLAVGCSEGQSTVAPSPTPNGGYHLIFFLNPNGGPCLMQERILAGMRNELQGKITVRYVKTTVEDDIPVFGRYGIRGLPSLVLVDASGKELKRLPPGVKSVEEIRGLIQATQ